MVLLDDVVQVRRCFGSGMDARLLKHTQSRDVFQTVVWLCSSRECRNQANTRITWPIVRILRAR